MAPEPTPRGEPGPGLRARLAAWAGRLGNELRALAAAARDPRTPWYARALALAVVAYALSPIDLIPDFIPVLGHLDDLLLVPLGLWLAIRLIPPDVMAAHRAAAAAAREVAGSRIAAGAIVALWIAVAVLLAWLLRDDIDNILSS